MAGNRYPLEIRPVVPAPLERLHDLADNLVYSWDRRIRGLFRRIDSELWDHCDHNPKIFLRRVSQQRLEALAEDSDFVTDFNAAVAAFDQYLQATLPAARRVDGLSAETDLVAYFSMEYGLHESMHLYSGGLGILAGDHCKAAADLGLPFVAVGLMYHQGYFSQTVDADGHQQAHYQPVELGDQPIHPVRGADDHQVEISVPLGGRTVQVRVWEARIGHVRLLLLDTETETNSADDRAITYQLYGGAHSRRIAQEIVLGIGGVRALRALGLEPTVWHINEGHPAFSIFERCRELVAAGVDFDTALEAVAASTVFTTHTPVPAGHDLFDRELMTEYFREFAGALGISLERLLELGKSPQDRDRFNMTALALRGSRHHNGVSRIHGTVASDMASYLWPQVPAAENPLTYITNGVHVPTFLAREWVDLFDSQAPGWRSHLTDADFWREHIAALSDQRYLSVRQLLKGHLLDYLRERLTEEYTVRHVSRGRIRSMREVMHPDNTSTLVIGFARRFATYKRALLLFQDPERLARLLNDPERPVILLYAGKAHPDDKPGQELIRTLMHYVDDPAFRDRVFFLESYGIKLARRLVCGVDVWLNNPQHPLEACGTSGQKAAINGVLNLSVLDGWWAEAYDGDNGWAVEPHGSDIPPDERDAAEADELLDLLEYEVIPGWYDNGGVSAEWIAHARTSMTTILPHFNSERMLIEYTERLYRPASAHGHRLAADGAAGARALAEWKQRVREHWDSVNLHWDDTTPASAATGETVRFAVEVHASDLDAQDIALELVLELDDGTVRRERFEHAGAGDNDLRYVLTLNDLPNGLLHYRVRAWPQHPALAHRFEMGLMSWL